jgi:hypothetical protein
VTLNISPCTNVTLTLALGWITLFMGDMGERALTEKTKQLSNKDIKIWSWAPLEARLQDERANRPSVAM